MSCFWRLHPVMELEVAIHSAEGLPLTSMGSPGDPYCECKVVQRKRQTTETKIRTPTISGTREPEWHFVGDMSLDSIYDTLEFSVWDENLIESSTLMGKVLLDSSFFYPNGWTGNLTLTGIQKPQGSIRVKISVKPPHAEVQKEWWRWCCGVDMAPR
eukprot:TRINITY_DN80076_c0_g1_i1.p1 TRINITY_DN80076_c0_g1~~TRINITY_DN80076_c0_g1_i1.p1  ORF type:complete len:157 (+),score=33.15 TRINITY_DN80076_c0_g1_i1:171-641(+)